MKAPLLLQAVKDLLFPPLCLFCGKALAGKRLRKGCCRDCQAMLSFIRAPLCPRCGLPFSGTGENHLCSACLTEKWSFDWARAILAYRGGIIPTVHGFKYQGRSTSLALYGALLQDADLAGGIPDFDWIIPVPLHPRRLRKRGFNQASLLAKAFFPDKKNLVNNDLLKRSKETPPQTGLSGQARRRNIRGAFEAADPAKIYGRSLLLVDDVFTTGTTVNECAKTLKKSGAAFVAVLTLARSLPDL